MPQLSREDHCALAGIDIEAFKSLQRLGRLPAIPDQFRSEKGYTALETMALAAADTMVQIHLLAREHAAAICSAAGILTTRWNEIRESSENPGLQTFFFG